MKYLIFEISFTASFDQSAHQCPALCRFGSLQTTQKENTFDQRWSLPASARSPRGRPTKGKKHLLNILDSERPKPLLFWFRSNIKNETQNGQYFRADIVTSRNHISKGEIFLLIV